jgi:hypothetical protein
VHDDFLSNVALLKKNYYLQPFKFTQLMKSRLPLIIAAAFILMAGVSSCNRDFICQCTIKYSGQPGLPDSLVKEYPIKDTKSKAKSVCEANSGTYENGGIKAEENCHLY